MSKKNTNLENKTERANRIAEQSKKVKRTYEKMEDFLFRVLRAFSTFLDKVLFNEKYSKVVSLVLAVLLYAIVNYNALSTSFQSSLRYSKTLSDVTVLAKYNSDTFEISGFPEKVDVILTGDAANVTSAANAENGTDILLCFLHQVTKVPLPVHASGVNGININSFLNSCTNSTFVLVPVLFKA